MTAVERGERHQQLMASAIERDAEGQRALLEGDDQAARAAFTAAAELYKRSWEVAPPGSYGRLVGMLKSAILAGGGSDQAEYLRAALADLQSASPTASYAQAIAAMIAGDDATAKRAAAEMRAGSEAFRRTADAVVAWSDRDQDSYAAALGEIVRDFEARERHLTGVPIADTGVMLERLAERRGMTAGVNSRLLPPTRC